MLEILSIIIILFIIYYLFKMRLLKTHPILGLANSFLIDSPQPANLSYMWNFGSLLGICLIVQILTGVFLAIHYSNTVDLAFISVEHLYYIIFKCL